MKCKICEVRKPRRYCPGVAGDICSLCCGNERESTVSCPLDCPFLREARVHDKPPALSPNDLPNRDVRVSDDFLRSQEEPLFLTGSALSAAAAATEGAVDRDLRDALDSLTRTYRTLSTGLYYDSRPENPFAAKIYGRIQEAVAELRKVLQKEGRTAPRDADLLGLFVFYQRLALTYDNGRPKCRWFIDFLSRQFGTAQGVPGQPAAGEPRIVTL